MMIAIIIVHVIICILLIGLILIQAGRGGGLVEAFSGVESMLGTKTSTFLTKSTTILSTLFFITCLALAVMSARQSRSLVGDRAPASATAQQAEEMPAAEEAAMAEQAAVEEVMVEQEDAPAQEIPGEEAVPIQ